MILTQLALRHQGLTVLGQRLSRTPLGKPKYHANVIPIEQNFGHL